VQNIITCSIRFQSGRCNARVLWCELAARFWRGLWHCNDLKGSNVVSKQVLRKDLFVLDCSSQWRYGLSGLPK